MKTKRTVFLIAKVAFAAVILTFLLRKVDVARIWAAILNARPAPIVLGVILCLLTIAIAGWRWHRLLSIIKIDIPLRSLICIVQIGQFFAMFLPGPAGDDLTRMLYISRLAKGRVGEACGTVFIDRLIGLASILFLSVFCIPWQWSLLAASRQTYWLALAALTGGVGVCAFGVFFFAFGRTARILFERCLCLLPATALREELARIWGLLCSNKRVVAEVFGAALITQSLVCGVYYLAGRAINVHAPPLVWLGFLPIVIVANMAPITVAGFGVREYLLVLFLGVLAHVESEAALAVSFVAFSMVFIVCLIGGAVYLFYRPEPADSPDNSSQLG